jgi:type II secretory pathway component PulJ
MCRRYEKSLRQHRRPYSRQAFTLVELLVATAVGVGLAGTVVLLLLQAATENNAMDSPTRPSKNKPTRCRLTLPAACAA